MNLTRMRDVQHKLTNCKITPHALLRSPHSQLLLSERFPSLVLDPTPTAAHACDGRVRADLGAGSVIAQLCVRHLKSTCSFLESQR